MDGAIVFLFVVVFCIALGFFVASAVYFRRETKVLKQILETQGNMLKDIGSVHASEGGSDGATDVEGLSALVELMSKQGQ